MIIKTDGELTKIDRAETLRYLGATHPDETLAPLLDECERFVLEAVKPAACHSVFDFSATGEKLDLGFARVESRSLLRHLEGCNKLVVFACTVGAGVDRLIQKYSRISPARAAVIQAMGSAAVESFCDMLCGQFVEMYGAQKSRFSCGYGDLDISLQRDIFAALQVTKHIGITLSSNYFMTPTKSVTAIVGIR